MVGEVCGEQCERADRPSVGRGEREVVASAGRGHALVCRVRPGEQVGVLGEQPVQADEGAGGLQGQGVGGGAGLEALVRGQLRQRGGVLGLGRGRDAAGRVSGRVCGFGLGWVGMIVGVGLG